MVRPSLSPSKITRAVSARLKSSQGSQPLGSSYNQLTEENFHQRAVKCHEDEDREKPFFAEITEDGIESKNFLPESKRRKRTKLTDGCDQKLFVVDSKEFNCYENQLLYRDVTSEVSVEIPVTQPKRRCSRRSHRPKLTRLKRRFKRLSNKSKNNNAKADEAKCDDTVSEKCLGDKSSGGHLAVNTNVNAINSARTDELDSSLDRLLRPDDAIIDSSFDKYIDDSHIAPSISKAPQTKPQQVAAQEDPPKEERNNRGLFSCCLAFFRKKFSSQRS